MRKLNKNFNGRFSFLADRWIWYGLRAIALEDGKRVQDIFTEMAHKLLTERGIPRPVEQQPAQDAAE